MIVQEIVGTHFGGIDGRVGVDVAGVDRVQQRVDFFLVENFLRAHGYCITKAVKYSASIFSASPPALLTTERTDSSDAACSFSLPSRVEIVVVLLVAEQHQQVVADARIVLLEHVCGVPRHAS